MKTQMLRRVVNRQELADAISAAAERLSFSCKERPFPFRLAENGTTPGMYPGILLYRCTKRVNAFGHIHIYIHARNTVVLSITQGEVGGRKDFFDKIDVGGALLRGFSRVSWEARHPGRLFHPEVEPYIDAFLALLHGELGYPATVVTT